MQSTIRATNINSIRVGVLNHGVLYKGGRLSEYCTVVKRTLYQSATLTVEKMTKNLEDAKSEVEVFETLNNTIKSKQIDTCNGKVIHEMDKILKVVVPRLGINPETFTSEYFKYNKCELNHVNPNAEMFTTPTFTDKLFNTQVEILALETSMRTCAISSLQFNITSNSEVFNPINLTGQKNPDFIATWEGNMIISYHTDLKCMPFHKILYLLKQDDKYQQIKCNIYFAGGLNENHVFSEHEAKVLASKVNHSILKHEEYYGPKCFDMMEFARYQLNIFIQNNTLKNLNGIAVAGPKMLGRIPIVDLFPKIE